VFGFTSSSGLSPGASARLRRVEQKLDLVLKHLGITTDIASPDPADPSGWPIEIRQPADAGRKIDAIKAHREDFGSTLLEAKQAIEAYLGQ
jgi:ribosomal protein L7/L12